MRIFMAILSIFLLVADYNISIAQKPDLGFVEEAFFYEEQALNSEFTDYDFSLDAFFRNLADLFNGEIKIEAQAPVIQKYNLASSKIVSPLRIVLLADLHSRVYIEDQKPLINAIKSQNPDIIILAGDIIDEKAPIIGAKLLFEGIKNICPIYYVNGNHEYLSNNIEAIEEYVRSYGINILSDEYVSFSINGNNLILGGIDDPEKKKKEDHSYFHEDSMRKAFSALSYDGEYKILIAHRPELIDSYKSFPFDLVLSGHAHGGQIRISPYTDGIISANQGLFPRYAGGLYHYSDMVHIVSRGLSNTLPIPRINNPTEIVVIELVSSYVAYAN